MLLFQLGDFSIVEPAYLMSLSKVPSSDLHEKYDYYIKLFSRLGSFFLNLGLLDAAKKIYQMLIKQSEHRFKESHGTVVYNPRNQSWRYRCKHPDVLKVRQSSH